MRDLVWNQHLQSPSTAALVEELREEHCDMPVWKATIQNAWKMPFWTASRIYVCILLNRSSQKFTTPSLRFHSLSEWMKAVRVTALHCPLGWRSSHLSNFLMPGNGKFCILYKRADTTLWFILKTIMLTPMCRKIRTTDLKTLLKLMHTKIMISY